MKSRQNWSTYVFLMKPKVESWLLVPSYVPCLDIFHLNFSIFFTSDLFRNVDMEGIVVLGGAVNFFITKKLFIGSLCTSVWWSNNLQMCPYREIHLISTRVLDTGTLWKGIIIYCRFDGKGEKFQTMIKKNNWGGPVLDRTNTERRSWKIYKKRSWRSTLAVTVVLAYNQLPPL